MVDGSPNVEYRPSFGGQGRRECGSFVHHVGTKLLFGVGVSDNDEVPRPAEANARGGVRGGEDPFKGAIRDPLTGKASADVTAAVDHCVEIGCRDRGGHEASLKEAPGRRFSVVRGRSPDSRIDVRASFPVPESASGVGSHFPFTVAGPCRILTGFPILPRRGTSRCGPI